MIVISSPKDICQCGHGKSFHVYLNEHPKPGESIVEVGPCCKCECEEYREPEKEEAA